jgi:hypothetical protein
VAARGAGAAVGDTGGRLRQARLSSDIAAKNDEGVAIVDYALDNRPSTGLGEGGRPAAVAPTRQASICSAPESLDDGEGAVVS